MVLSKHGRQNRHPAIWADRIGHIAAQGLEAIAAASCSAGFGPGLLRHPRSAAMAKVLIDTPLEGYLASSCRHFRHRFSYRPAACAYAGRLGIARPARIRHGPLNFGQGKDRPDRAALALIRPRGATCLRRKARRIARS